MPRRPLVIALVLAVLLLGSLPAAAQRLTFERSYPVSASTSLDVSTTNGAVTITQGTADRLVVHGTVTVRVGFNVPANALALARRVVDAPPVVHADGVLHLGIPTGADERRAVTVSYEVLVPPLTPIVAATQSGKVAIGGVHGRIDVRSQSGALDLEDIAAAHVRSGSGTIAIADASGDIDVSSVSGAMEMRGVGGSLRVRTSSGSVDIDITGTGDVDVETQSSAITLHGVRGSLLVATRSGRVRVAGTPGRAWTVSTESGAVEVSVGEKDALTLSATTRSGSIRLSTLAVDGVVTTRRVDGAVNGGGPTVTLRSRSGSLQINPD